MNWDDLQPFLALMREGTLSGAARQLNVEHATVARRIDRLETAFGQKLFDRLPRGWQPTPAASALLPQAEAAEVVIHEMRRQAGLNVAGPVRLSVPPLIATELVAPSVLHFLNEHPDIRLSLEAEQGRTRLLQGEADIAVRIGPVEGQSLRMRRVGHVVYRPFGLHPKLGVIRSLEPRTETEQWMDQWSGSREVVLACSDTSVARIAAQTGLGIALLPSFYAKGLQAIGEDYLERPLHIVMHEDKARSEQVQIVAEFLSRVLKRGLRDSLR